MTKKKVDTERELEARASREPTDATMRNVRAANKRLMALEDTVSGLVEMTNALADEVSALGKRVTALEPLPPAPSPSTLPSPPFAE